MAFPANLNLLTGPFPLIVAGLGVASLVWLIVAGKRHLLLTVPIAAALAVAITVCVWFVTERVLNLWGAPLPLRLYVAVGFILLGAALIVPRFRRARQLGGRILTVLAVPLLVLAVAANINTYFGAYPTAGSLFGAKTVNIRSVKVLKHPATNPAHHNPQLTRAAAWTPPAGMPKKGVVVKVAIPGPSSGVGALRGYVYLPPAFLGSPQAKPPVLVLLHGIPGSPKDWLTSGQLPAIMNTYAAAHKGLAPIVVMPNANQGTLTKPSLCMNTTHGKAATYLAVDVPNWIKKTFGAGLGSASQWAVAGLSYGGTCAVQLAVNYPKVYPTFISMSGEIAPSISAGRHALIHDYFNGNAAAFARQNALDVMKTRTFPHTAGIITVGAQDRYFKPQGLAVYAAARKAGMNVSLQVIPGAHTWKVWRTALRTNVDWLMKRFGVVTH